jgi:hypothetical protein
MPKIGMKSGSFHFNDTQPCIIYSCAAPSLNRYVDLLAPSESILLACLPMALPVLCACVTVMFPASPRSRTTHARPHQA